MLVLFMVPGAGTVLGLAKTKRAVISMVERYRYSGGEFIRFGDNFEEWQGGKARYHFKKIRGDRNWLYLVDHSDPVRSISIKLPYNGGASNGGMSYIKWAGTWDDGLPWIDFHPMTVLHKAAPEPMFQLNSPTFRSAGRYTKARAQSLARTSGVLQVDGLLPGKWPGLASATLIHGVVVLTTVHDLEMARVMVPNFKDTDIAVTFNYDYTAATADRKPKGDLNPNRPWARVRKVIEEGSSLGLDYALLLVRWEPQWAPNPVTVTSPIANRAPTMGENVLAIQHPAYFKIGDYVDTMGVNHRLYEAPTQVSAGDVYDLLQAPHVTHGDNVNAYAFFKCQAGSSGGGVFDTNGNLIGVIGGENRGEGMSYFIQIDKIVERSRRLRIMLGLEPYPLPVAASTVAFPAPLLPEDLPFL